MTTIKFAYDHYDHYDAETLEGFTPTPWLFYTGVDGEPGRLFENTQHGLPLSEVIVYICSDFTESKSEQIDKNDVLFIFSDKIASLNGEELWHDSLGLKVPDILK